MGASFAQYSRTQRRAAILRDAWRLRPNAAREDARDFARALGQVSRNPVVYAELPGAMHNFDLFYSLRLWLWQTALKLLPIGCALLPHVPLSQKHGR
jgi:hypothetical protein